MQAVVLRTVHKHDRESPEVPRMKTIIFCTDILPKILVILGLLTARVRCCSPPLRILNSFLACCDLYAHAEHTRKELVRTICISSLRACST